MNSDLHRSPLAITFDGEVLVNVEQFTTDGSTMAEVVAIAQAEPGAVFIGVPLSHPEIQQVLHRLRHGCHEAVAYMIGSRLKVRRREP